MPNPYSILKISPDATVEEIEAAYEQLFDKYEPRAQSGDARASAMLEQLNEAFDALTGAENGVYPDVEIVAPRSAKAATTSRAKAAPTGRAQSRPQPYKQRQATGRSGTGSQTIRTRARTRDLDRYVDQRPRLPLVPLTILALVVFGLAAVVSYMIISKKDSAPAENRGTVVATVNGEPIYEQDYLERVEIDKQGALDDPIFGGYFKTLTPFSQTQVLETLKSDFARPPHQF